MGMNSRRALALIIMLMALLLAAACTSQEPDRQNHTEAGAELMPPLQEQGSEGQAGAEAEHKPVSGPESESENPASPEAGGNVGASEGTDGEEASVEGADSEEVAAGGAGGEEGAEGANGEEGEGEGAADRDAELMEPVEPTESEELSYERKRNLPQGFVYLDEVIAGAQYELRYITDNNFVGKPIDGYVAPVPIMSAAGAEALAQVQATLEPDGYGLKIFDAYRPQKAVNHFKAWSADAEDTLMKEQYYPELDKANLFKLGYIASKSGHSRGGTVDLTLVMLETGAEVDMGGPYDFFGEISHYNTSEISKEQRANRERLRKVMEQFGFKGYSKEWWHFTLVSEPFPKQYFDFDVE